MNKTELNKMPVPKYNKGQRDLNSLTHFIGAIIAFGIYVALIVLMSRKGIYKFVDYLAITFYSLASIASFTISTIYHLDKTDSKKKRIKRLLDHLTIFTTICGTYVAICVLGLKGTVEEIAILSTELSLMVVGIILNTYHMEKKPVRIISIFLYVIMGWLILFIPSAFKQLPWMSFVFLLASGVVDTTGTILYAIGHLKNQWFHVVFHIFIVAGAILQAVSIFYLII